MTTDPNHASAPATATWPVAQFVRHLVAAQIDNPDHIYLISPGTQSHELLLAAAAEVYGLTAADIRSRIKARRAEVESHHPMVAAVVRVRDEAARYERALDVIAYGSPAEPRDVARRALGALADEPATTARTT